MENTGKQSKSVRILDLLEASPNGLRFTDIQYALWEMSNNGGFDRRDGGKPSMRVTRGYWCTNLLGGLYYHQGLLRFFAKKGPDGRWRRNSVSHNGRPWATMRSQFKFTRAPMIDFDDE